MIINFNKPSEIKTTSLLPKHDLVFRSPVCDPTYGIPLGNGSLGSLIYFKENGLNIQINHTDLIDDIAKDSEYCFAGDEGNTICRNGALLSIDFSCPVFETIYQKDFCARLSLKDATAKIKSDTPFSAINLDAFCSEKHNVLVINLKGKFQDQTPVTCSLSRYGSRTFMYWYAFFVDQPDAGLSGTNTTIEDDLVCLTQQLNGLNFCLALTAITKDNINKEAINARLAKLSLNNAKQCDFIIFATIATAQTVSQAKEQAKAQLKNALTLSFEKIYDEHKFSWENFWNKSFVSLPKEQDYLENLWYLNLYYANSQMKGKYPPHFCNGLWGFYHDFVPWNCYFHYNSQLGYFPLETANHPELTSVYHNFRRSQLENAKHFAKNVKNSKGAFYTDVCDYKGRFTKNTKDNCTCGAQIAMGMYSHYLYTNDNDFLQEVAIPVMIETAKYYIDNLKLGEDGFYHIYKTQGYEGSPLFDDSITDHVMIRTLFGALTKVLPNDKAGIYKRYLDRLAPFIFDNLLCDEVDENGNFAVGIGKGLTPKTDKVMSVGLGENGKKMRKTSTSPENQFYGFPDTEMSLLFPSSLIGLKDKGTDLFNAVYNDCCLHTEVDFDPKNGTPKHCMGWCMMPIYLARLGETQLFKKQLSQTTSWWITYPQGFGSYSPNDHVISVLTDKFYNYNVTECYTGRKSNIPSFNFRHFDYETLPILATAVNESLLQSHDGTLRLFPAVDKTDAVSFSLAAVGGFIVNAVYDSGKFFAEIFSKYGFELKIAFYNVEEKIIFTDEDGKPLSAKKFGDDYILSTSKNESVFIQTITVPNFNREYDKNQDAKTLGNSSLGSKRQF